ncbi:DoxX family protein [Pseudonocardia sp. KRD-182]|uniref:DoxX family protein n=1 Tax=Pseudonocardia oceani TaxID=2792013 RepID=UPI001C49E1D0|nr:DoxX family protein [Pseudonocardia oceani]MBW0108362.1 DoxX family protein [Pseudonocardia oceani]
MSDQPTSVFTPGSIGEPEPTKTRPTRRPLEWNAGTDAGLLLLRFAIGGTFVAHGMQNVFGLWGGPGIGGFARVLDGFGFRETLALSWATGITELVAGAFVVLGVGTPLAAAGLVAVMLNVVLLKLGAGGGFFATDPRGVELEAVLGLGAAALVLTGAGHIALERGRTWNRRPAPWGVLAMIIGVAAGLLVFFLLRSPVPVAP